MPAEWRLDGSKGPTQCAQSVAIRATGVYGIRQTTIVVASAAEAGYAANALDPVFDNGANGAVTSAQISARRNEALKGKLKPDLTIGSGVDALSRAPIIEATCQVPYLAHATVEPMNATARYRHRAWKRQWPAPDGASTATF